jgi:hypothetical protein
MRIALSVSGDIFLTSVRDGAIIRRTPDGTHEIFTRIDGSVSGIVTTPDDGLFVRSRQPHRPESICFIDARGRVERGGCLKRATCRVVYTWYDTSPDLLVAEALGLVKGVSWQCGEQTKKPRL